MDFLRVLEQAQQGNYDSYELLTTSLQENPSQVLQFFEYFCVESNPKPSKDLVGLFIKNWLGKEAGKLWWESFPNKTELVQRVLSAENTPNVASMVLVGLITVEHQQESVDLAQLLISANSKSSVLALSYYLESSRTVLQVIPTYLASVIPALLHSDPVLALQVFQKSVKHLAPSPAIFSLFGLIFNLLDSVKDEILVLEIYKSVVDLVSHFYDNLQEYFEKIVQIVLQGVNHSDSQVSHLSYECLNVLVDLEKQKKLESLLSFEVIDRYSEHILLGLMKKIEESDDEEEILTVSSTVQGICETIPEKVVLMLPALGNKLQSSEIRTRVCGVYVFGSAIPSLTAEKLESMKSEIFTAVSMALNDQHPEMKNASIWLVYKIAESIPDVISCFPIIFEILYQSLDNPHKMGIDCLLEIADGEILVPHPEKFIKKLMDLGLNSKFVNSFNVIRAIVQSMPVESIYLKSVITSLIPLIASNHKHLSSLSIILRACIEKLSETQVQELYQPLFVILQTIPQSDEYLVAVSCLSRHPAFRSYISIFTAALSRAIAVRESYQSAVICVSELVRNLEFSDWLPPLMPDVVKLLDMKAHPNTQIIEALTDIVSLHTETCLPFILELLQYGEYCVQFCLSDFDDPEFLAEIRELMVSFYEGVIQGLESIGKIEIIAPKVQEIIRFCVIITSDEQFPNQNIVAGAIGIFADVALAFGTLPDREKILEFIKRFVSSDSEIVKLNAECAFRTISKLE